MRVLGSRDMTHTKTLVLGLVIWVIVFWEVWVSEGWI